MTEGEATSTAHRGIRGHTRFRRCSPVEVMTCSRCGERMCLVEISYSRDNIARVLAAIGLGPRPPPWPGPHPGQLDFDSPLDRHRPTRSH